MKNRKKYNQVLLQTIILTAGTIWCIYFVITGLLFAKTLLPEVTKVVEGRMGIEAWLYALIPLYFILNVVGIGAYLFYWLTRRFAPRVFEPIKGKIEIEREGGKRKWYQRLLS